MPEIGASLANSAASGADPFEEDGTVFIFGNSDTPSLEGEQTPSVTSTATATTALPGGTAVSNVGTSNPTPGAGVAGIATPASAGGLSTMTILLLAGAAILAVHFLHKP